MVADSSHPTFTPGAEIRETYRKIDAPQQKPARDLVAFWQERPADGLVVGRDIPSRKMAAHLAHVLLWEPTPDGRDMLLNLAGEALRVRFGGNAIGRKFSELLDPDIVPAFLECGRSFLSEEACACFDFWLQRQNALDGVANLHFELVAFPVWSPGRLGRWILNGLYYFE
jgi:hypothetical protein